MRYTGWYLVDPVISIAIGLLIMAGAWRVLREAIHILMEGVPQGMSVEQVATSIRNMEGVADVHHLNIWSVCSHIVALSAHVEIQPEYGGKRDVLLHRIEHELAHTFHITHTTIQFDCSACNGGPLIKDLTHTERRAGAHRH